MQNNIALKNNTELDKYAESKKSVSIVSIIIVYLKW